MKNTANNMVKGSWLIVLLAFFSLHSINAQTVLLGRSINSNLSVGSTAGTHAVTPSGGASYTIP